MASFGLRLKQEREKQAITLDDISLTTKISTRMLRALEEEQFDQLPGGIFNKGFIRAYARCLKMDEDQVVADYLATVNPPGKKPEGDDAPVILEPPSRQEVRQELRENAEDAAGIPWGSLAVALLIVALGFAGWGYYSRDAHKDIQPSAAPPAPTPNVTPAPVESVAPRQPVESAPIAQSPQATAPPPASAEPAQAPVVTPPVSTPEQSTTAPTAGLVVRIKARQDSWLSISVDGEVSTRAILSASSEKSVRGTDEIVVRAGNVGALDFELNGKKLPVQGAVGEARTLVFNTHGLQPTAPQPEAPAQPQ